MNIFELVNAHEIGLYWSAVSSQDRPFVGETLFPAQKKVGLNLSWIKGSSGLPVALNVSAFDAKAIPRSRVGFSEMSGQMPYFKESVYIDEETRQNINMAIESGNQYLIDALVNRIFDDAASLIRSARVSAEKLRMLALTTGVVSLVSNGQVLTYDYGVTHQSEVTTSWSNTTSATPVEDIQAAKDAILDDTGDTVTRAICNSITWRYLKQNESIKSDIYAKTPTVGNVTDNQLRTYLIDMLDIAVYVNDKKYLDFDGTSGKYVGDNIFSMFPDGNLGSTWYGTTPEESDLMVGTETPVEIVDKGVAITTIKHADPVTVETKASMICLPSFEAADSVYILDTKVGA